MRKQPFNSNQSLELVAQLVRALGYSQGKTYDALLALTLEELKALPECPEAIYLKAKLLGFQESQLSDEALSEKYNAMIEEAALGGSARAQYEWGCLQWERGRFSEAIKLYYKAAEQGDAPSQYCLGLGLISGEGVEKNIEQGRLWIELAAGQLYDLALEHLMAEYEKDGSEDGVRKFELYSKMLKWACADCGVAFR